MMNVLRNYKAVWIVAFSAVGLWSHVSLSPVVSHSPLVERNLAAIDEIDQIDIDITMGKIEAAEYNQELERLAKKQPSLQERLKRIAELSSQSENLRQSIEKTKIEKEHLTSLIERESFSDDEVNEINQTILSIEAKFNESSEQLVSLEELLKIEMDKVSELFDSKEKAHLQEQLAEIESDVQEHQKSSAELSEELHKLTDSMEEKDKDIEKLKLKNAELIKTEKEIRKNLCEHQQKTSNLESEISSLLEDKEVVTAKILSLATKKDDLLKDIDDLKDYVKPKNKEDDKKIKNAPLASNDIAALLAAITNLTQQLQLSQQFQMPQPMFGGNAWNSWSNMGGFMMMQQQQQQIIAPAWMNGIGGESLSGNPGYNPMGVNRKFINQNTFQMERPYGSDLLDQSKQSQFDFGMVRRSFQPDHQIQGRDVSSVFFDFSQ